MNTEILPRVICFTVVCCLCGGIFLGVGCWAKVRKTPMHFWSGTEVDPRDLTDVSAYNRANAHMWMGFSTVFWLSACFEILSIWFSWAGIVAFVLLMLGVLPGTILMGVVYCKIFEKYKTA